MSDLSEEYEFSQYKELNQLDKKSKVVVVQQNLGEKKYRKEKFTCM